MNQINDPGVPPEERLAALRVVAGQETFPDWVVESKQSHPHLLLLQPLHPLGRALADGADAAELAATAPRL